VPAAVVAAALVGGCGEDPAVPEAQAGGRGTTTPASAVDRSDLLGTWRTEELPLERVRGVFLDAGGSEAQWDGFYALLDGARTFSFVLEVTEDHWSQLQHHDGGPAIHGWLGTWSMEEDVVRATEVGNNCWFDYRIALDRQQLAAAVIDAEDAAPCEEDGAFIHAAIFESAPFTRVE